MDTILSVFLTFAIVYGAYMIFCAVMSHIGASELEKVGIDPDGGDIVFRADARTLEYLVTCAAWATTFERRKIVVLIDSGGADAEEMISDIKKMSRRYKNLYYRRT